MMPAGAINAWDCPNCGQLTVARHADEGVTPMFLACRATDGCTGMAASLGYPDQDNVPQHIVDQIAWEWYRPTTRWTRRQSVEMRRHIEAGGLALRPLVTADDVAEARRILGGEGGR